MEVILVELKLILIIILEIYLVEENILEEFWGTQVMGLKQIIIII